MARRPEPRRRRVLVQRIRLVALPDRRVARQDRTVEVVLDLHVRSDRAQDPRERPLPGGDRRLERRRAQDEEVGQRTRRLGEHVAEGEEAAERMPEQDDRATAGRRADGREPILEIVVDHAPAIDERPPARRAAEPALVVGVDLEAGRRELLPDVLVAPGVLARPWTSRTDAQGSPAAVQCRTSSSVPSRAASVSLRLSSGHAS